MTIDERLRTLLEADVATAPAPPTVEEILARAHGTKPSIVPALRPFAPAVGRLAAAAAVVTVVVAGLVAINNRDSDSSEELPPASAPPTARSIPPAAGERLGTYFLPTGLPESYRLLAVTEHAVAPGRINTARAVYATSDDGRIELTPADPEIDRTTWANTVPLGGGAVGSWSSRDVGGAGPWIEFEVEFPDAVRVAGTARGVAPEAIADVLNAVRPGQPGLPSALADTDYTLVAESATAPYDVAVEWSAYFGPPGGYLGADSVEVTVRRYGHVLDVALEQGVWNDTVDANGRTVYLGFLNSSPAWYPEPDLEVSVEAFGGLDSVDVLAGLESVDDASFGAAVSTIEAGADAISVAQTVAFSQGYIDVLGELNSPKGVCLTVEGGRRCDLAVMARAGYTEGDAIVFFDTELLVGARWFTVGLRVPHDGAFIPPVPAGAEVVQVDDRTYYLLEQPLDATEIRQADGDVIARPAR